MLMTHNPALFESSFSEKKEHGQRVPILNGDDMLHEPSEIPE
jgi:hypothetical protein